MLVISRKTGEEIVIDERIRIIVTSIHRARVRLAIRAPGCVRVDRREIHERRLSECSDVTDDDAVA